MKCNNCGTENKLEAKFCKTCGKKLELIPDINHNELRNVATYELTEEQLPAKYRPIGAWAYFGWTLLFNLPIAGWIIALVFAVGKTENVNLKNFARSMFCFVVIVAVFLFLIMGTAGCTAGMLWN